MPDYMLIKKLNKNEGKQCKRRQEKKKRTNLSKNETTSMQFSWNRLFVCLRVLRKNRRIKETNNANTFLIVLILHDIKLRIFFTCKMCFFAFFFAHWFRILKKAKKKKNESLQATFKLLKRKMYVFGKNSQSICKW